MKLNGAEIVVECLKEQKVKYIFGYPGAATINIYDELYKNQEHIEHILTSHEQGASHAADGYARSSGKVGVCLATSGPGATNLVTGIATAYIDSVPLVAITGNVEMKKLGNDSFQEVDIYGITMPITKHNYMVKNIDELADVIREAFYIANSGRKGPVLIDIPKNITEEIGEYGYIVPKKPSRNEEKDIVISDNFLQILKKAKRTLIISGGGVVRSQANKELAEFAECIDAPVAATLMGIGSMPYDHELYMGTIGMHGSLVSNKMIDEADVILVIGGRFSDRVVGKKEEFGRNAKLLHIDIDAAEINKNVVVDDYVVGDVKLVLQKLNKKVKKKNCEKWKNYAIDLEKKYGFRVNKEIMNVPYLIKKIAEHAGENTLVSTDVGQHQMWTAQHYPIMKPGQLLTSGGLGTMGYGLGAAIGAKFANPEKTVVMITGDGSFKMNFNEFITAAKNKLPIKIFIMNNKALGMVRQWQDLFYDQRFASTPLDDDDVDYVMLAKAMGGEGYTITSVDEIDPTMEKVFAQPKPVIVNCLVDTNANVYPMVPPGKAVHEAIASKDEME